MATVINNDYKTGLKRELVRALKPVFGPSYPNKNLAGKVNVSYEYPRTEELYPAIYLSFTESTIENMGISHFEVEFEDGPKKVYHWKFKGQLNFNILALTPTDRDELTAGLLNVLALGRDDAEFGQFFDEVMDSDWVSLHILADQITPRGESTPSPAPFSDQRFIYHAAYSIPIFGEFWSDSYSGGLIQISRVILDPYREGEQPAPW